MTSSWKGTQIKLPSCQQNLNSLKQMVRDELYDFDWLIKQILSLERILHKITINPVTSLVFLKFDSDLKKHRVSVRSWYTSGMMPFNSVYFSRATSGDMDLKPDSSPDSWLRYQNLKRRLLLHLGCNVPFHLSSF